MTSDDRTALRAEGSAPSLLLRPRAEDRLLLPRASGLFKGYHLGANQSDLMTEAVREYGKPLVIDPQTYIFGVPPSRHRDTEKKALRSTSAVLATAYGEPFSSLVGVRKIVPEDFADSALTLGAVQRVLNYQRNKSLGQMGLPLDPYYEKYRLWDEDSAGPGVMPQVLVPPYFYVRSASDPWLAANLNVARLALASRRGQERVYPVLLFSAGLLDDMLAVEALAAAYLSEDFDGYLLWPNKFDEARQSPERLRALATLVDRLASSGRRVSKLYGGYWSALMGVRGLSGFSCGLGYWSSRNAFAYGGRGGVRPKNYYIPQLHLEVPFDDAARMIEAEPRLRCDCPVCRDTWGRRADAFVAMKEGVRCEAHFVHVRRLEMGRIAEASPRTVIRELKAEREVLRTSPLSTDFLDVWFRSLAS